ncbi:hypothetical protein AABB24_009495, partial [Solanum stoloniferum]
TNNFIQFLDLEKLVSIMQVERSSKQGGFMTTKFTLSFGKSAQNNKVETKPKVIFTKPAANLFVTPAETKVYGGGGGSGDKNVDDKATNYISQVKERLRLEEMLHAEK